MHKILIGVDMSLRSPSWVIHNTETREMFAYFCANRKKDIHRNTSFVNSVGNENIVYNLIPFLPINCKSLIKRYSYIVDMFIESINIHCNNPHYTTKVIIEGYSYNAKSSSCAQLHELGGIIKYRLYQKQIEFVEISPTRIKKLFTGYGKASKLEMFNEFINKGFPDLKSEFEMLKCKDVPNPVQDIVDATAICVIYKG